ncbi:hypothetical protein LOK49_LG12G01959 [Camellia lanceoleosa]|uniref:Uncharacterized protein n=1 Tax=Camellia lanceoleosa TaxID=1840588 RepID=A0ACC0FVX8_9ERIC|nr:hypothetical protein LOK49_LG12G01959 [Camellia lanceoleosa]
MVDGGGANFPVVFYDGEREINMGSVRIEASQDFKNFQSGLSQKIGISPNQITIYLVDCKKPKSSTEVRRKIPVTGKMNFAAVVKETDCFFLAVLKRTRRNRRPKPKQKQGGSGSGVEFVDYLPEKLLLLRRNEPELNNLGRYNQIASPEFLNYNERLMNLQIQRENYAMLMNSNAISTLNLDLDSDLGLDSDPDSFSEERFGDSIATRPFCEECANARMKGITAPFHCCVLDPLVKGFRSTAGPIARPRKSALL